MDEDLISCLTRQVREDVIENYLTERRLIGFQIEEVQNQAVAVRALAQKTGRRLHRLIQLMIHPEMVKRLFALLKVPQPSFWHDCSQERFSRGVRFIHVRALTDRGKFRKLVLEAYLRLYRRMRRYEEAYDELSSLCQAVNSNIKHFQGNFDLLTILSFLKSLDTTTLERKQFLGENFTAEEIASVDQKLYIGLIKFEELEVPAPLPLPAPDQAEPPIADLVQEVYGKYQKFVKRLLK
jgi:hypothetical protein